VSSACPNGHESKTDDYCDQCGFRLAPCTPPSPVEAPVAPTASDGTEPSPTACPVCGDGREPGARFCEGCGADLDDPGVQAATPGRLPSADTTSGAVEWQLVATCDRSYFERVEAEGVDFPISAADRTFLLSKNRVAIGRQSEVGPDEQAVDLSYPPTDSGISRRHALLIRQGHGTWAVIDRESTNGTYLNDSADPISCQEFIEVGEGDEIHLGAWTTITLRSVPAHSTLGPPPAASSAAASRPQ
jgi:FHA domain-containing protein